MQGWVVQIMVLRTPTTCMWIQHTQCVSVYDHRSWLSCLSYISPRRSLYYTHSGMKLHLCYRDFNERIKMNYRSGYTHIQDFYYECTYVCIHAHMHVHSRTYVHILSTYMYICKCWQHRFVLFMSRTHSYIHVYINHQHTVFSSENRQLHPYSSSLSDDWVLYQSQSRCSWEKIMD